MADNTNSKAISILMSLMKMRSENAHRAATEALATERNQRQTDMANFQMQQNQNAFELNQQRFALEQSRARDQIEKDYEALRGKANDIVGNFVKSRTTWEFNKAKAEAAAAKSAKPAAVNVLDGNMNTLINEYDKWAKAAGVGAPVDGLITQLTKDERGLFGPTRASIVKHGVDAYDFLRKYHALPPEQRAGFKDVVISKVFPTPTNVDFSASEPKASRRELEANEFLNAPKEKWMESRLGSIGIAKPGAAAPDTRTESPIPAGVEFSTQHDMTTGPIVKTGPHSYSNVVKGPDPEANAAYKKGFVSEYFPGQEVSVRTPVAVDPLTAGSKGKTPASVADIPALSGLSAIKHVADESNKFFGEFRKRFPGENIPGLKELKNAAPAATSAGLQSAFVNMFGGSIPKEARASAFGEFVKSASRHGLVQPMVSGGLGINSGLQYDPKAFKWD